MPLAHRPLDEIFDAHIALEVADGAPSPRTVAAYRASLAGFLSWVEAEGIDAVSATRKDILGFRAAIQGKGLSRSAISLHLVAVRTLYRALITEGLRTDNPADGVRPGRPRPEADGAGQILERAISHAEIAAALSSPDPARPLGVRDRAAVALLAGTGPRVAEVVALDLDDLDLHGGWVTFEGKGRRRRTIECPPSACESLRMWLEVREQVATEASDQAVFIALDPRCRGRRLTTRAVQRLLDRHLGSLKRRGIGPHGARHLYGTHLAAAGLSLPVIGGALGHSASSVATTMRYVDAAGRALAGLGAISEGIFSSLFPPPASHKTH